MNPGAPRLPVAAPPGSGAQPTGPTPGTTLRTLIATYGDSVVSRLGVHPPDPFLYDLTLAELAQDMGVAVDTLLDRLDTPRR